jgi:hypothetical protein
MINERGSRGKSYVREKHGAFILKHDYMTIIIDSIVEYFRYNSHEEYDPDPNHKRPSLLVLKIGE